MFKYNGMIISMFEFIVDICDKIIFIILVVNVKCDFWFVEVNFVFVIYGGSVG